MKKLKGGIETVIAAVILIGIVTAVLLTVVIPMSNSGDDLIAETTGALVTQQSTIKPNGVE